MPNQVHFTTALTQRDLYRYTSSMQLFVRAIYWTAHITFLWNKNFLELLVLRPLQLTGFIKIKELAKLSRSPVSCVSRQRK